VSLGYLVGVAQSVHWRSLEHLVEAREVIVEHQVEIAVDGGEHGVEGG